MKQENIESNVLEELCTAITDNPIRVGGQRGAAIRCGFRYHPSYIGLNESEVFQIKFTFLTKRRFGLPEGNTVIKVADTTGDNPVKKHFVSIRYPLFADKEDAYQKLGQFYRELTKLDRGTK